MLRGITIDIDPIALDIGNFQLRWYSVALIVAILAAILIAYFEGKRKGVKTDEIFTLAPWILVGGFIGSRLFHVLDQWQYYSADLFRIIQFQQGGLSIWGAIIGGGITLIIFSRVRHVSLGQLADVLTPALLTAQIIGRVGSLINGDAYGFYTNLPWGLIYTYPTALLPPELYSVPTHPFPLYEMLLDGVLLAVILKFRNLFTRDGTMFLTYLMFYSLGSFILSYTRLERLFLAGLHLTQLISIVTLLIAVVWLFVIRRRSGAVPADTGAPADTPDAGEQPDSGQPAP